MKVKVPLGLLLLFASALGYMLGTENGRQYRDVILVKVGRKEAETADPESEASAEAEPVEA